MQQVCEICGAVIHSQLNKVEVDGAIMRVCNSCSKLGRPIRVETGLRGPQLSPMQAALKSITQRPMEPEYDIDPDYHLKIRQARQKMALSQEDLGKLINEKPSLLRLIETKRLKPDIILTRKLMHHLKVNLLVPMSEFEKMK